MVTTGRWRAEDSFVGGAGGAGGVGIGTGGPGSEREEALPYGYISYTWLFRRETRLDLCHFIGLGSDIEDKRPLRAARRRCFPVALDRSSLVHRRPRRSGQTLLYIHIAPFGPGHPSLMKSRYLFGARNKTPPLASCSKHPHISSTVPMSPAYAPRSLCETPYYLVVHSISNYRSIL